MDQNFSIKAILSAIDQGFTSTLDAAAAKAQEFADGSRITMEGLGTGMSVAGAAITALGTKSLTSFGQFEASLNQAAVVAGGTAKDIGQLDDLANKMGADLPLSAQDCADAMIEMARNGASISDIKQQFPAIAQAATAAGSDIKATAGVVQEAMNIWGKSLESPQQAAAILVQTANASNASVEDMSQALATIGGTANGAGMNLQTTSEAIGLLTNRGFSAAQASMDLNHAVLQMQAPSKVAKDAMGDLGISFVDAQGKMKKFPDILRELNQALDGLNPDEKAQKLKAMFGTAGMQAIVPLLDSVKNKTNDAKVSWDAYAKEQDKAAGSTKQANKTLQDQANEMQKNVGSSIEQLGGNWESLRNKSMKSAQDINGLLIKNANQTLQWATDSNSGIAQVVRSFIGLSPSIGTATTAVGLFLRNAKTIVGTVGSGVSAISNFVKTARGIGQIVTGVKTADEALGALAKTSKIAAAAQSVATTIQETYAIVTGKLAVEQASLSAVMLTSPLTWMIVGIIAVVAALTLFFTQTKTGRQMWGSFVSWLQGLWQGLVQVAQNVWNAIPQVFTNVIAGIQSVWGGISSFFVRLWNGIVNVVKSIWNGLVSFFAPLVSAIAAIWQGLVTFVVNIWNSFIAGLIPIISGIKDLFNSLVGFFQALWNLIVTVAKIIWQGFVIFFTPIVAAIKVIWNGLKVFFTVLWKGIVVVAKTTWNVILTVIRVVVTVIQAIWKPISIFFKVLWRGILLVVTTVWNQIRARIALAFKLIQIVIKTGMQIIKTIFSNGWKILTTIVSTVWKIISTIISGVLHTIAAIIRTITAAIRGDWSGVWNGIQSIISTVWNTIKSVVQTGINAIQSIVTTVMNAVKGVFSSVWDAIKGVFTAGVQFIKDAMHFDLFAQGQAIMNSLFNGLKSIWENIKSFVGGIANWIKEHKGPISYDEVLLVPAGNAIMAGFNEGLQNGFDNVQTNVTNMAGVISNLVTDTMDNAKNTLNDTDLTIPQINSQKFTDSVNQLNANLTGGDITSNINLNQSSQSRMNQLLEKIADKDTTMVLDTGKFVGATTQKYDASLGRNLADNERWT